MQRMFGSWSRTITAIGLAIGISFSGSVANTVLAQDDHDSREFTAYLYQGTISDLDNTKVIDDIEAVEEFGNNGSNNGRDGNRGRDDRDDKWESDRHHDWDDDDWDDDDWDDDDWDDDDWDDDDWDDDDWDDDDWDDDDWDDFGGTGLTLDGNHENFRLHAQHDATTENALWNMLGNGESEPDDLFTSQGKIDDDYDLTVESLVDGEYMIVVHESADTDSAIIAAGDIEGDIENGSILLDLQEINGSGFSGRTHIEVIDDDDSDDLIVTVGIFPAGSIGALDVAAPRG